MKLRSIVAMTRDNVIGVGDEIPWHYPQDFRHFKSTTVGHPVIMGRKTWNSIPVKFRPLPGRLNVVISSDPENVEIVPGSITGPNQLVIVSDPYKACAAVMACHGNDVEAWVMGGATIYEFFKDAVTAAVITRVPDRIDPTTEGAVIADAVGKDLRLRRQDDMGDGLIVEHWEADRPPPDAVSIVRGFAAG